MDITFSNLLLKSVARVSKIIKKIGVILFCILENGKNKRLESFYIFFRNIKQIANLSTPYSYSTLFVRFFFNLKIITVVLNF